MRKRIVGNWKMNGMRSDLAEIFAISQAARQYVNVDYGLCLPATLIAPAVVAAPDFSIGGQDCHMAQSGAHTGCVSANMLADSGANMVIVGHSERRAAQGESDADIRGKALAAIETGLFVIICVGETEAERDAGEAENIVLSQIDGSLPEAMQPGTLCVAYEPVWAIGTGRIPSDADVEAMHGAIRARLLQRFGDSGAGINILYGGSMNGDNAPALLAIPNVDGGLIGGASLSAAKFEPILAAADK
jgi:triosephosphate isomerase (TIM)